MRWCQRQGVSRTMLTTTTVAAGVDDALIGTEQFRKGTVASDATTGLRLLTKTYFKGIASEERQDYAERNWL